MFIMQRFKLFYHTANKTTKNICKPHFLLNNFCYEYGVLVPFYAISLSFHLPLTRL